MSGEREHTGSNKKDTRTVLVMGGPVFDPMLLAKKMLAAADTNRRLNDMTLHDPHFRAACEAAEIPATKRQAKKFRQRKGKAFTIGQRKLRELRAEAEAARSAVSAEQFKAEATNDS